MRSPFRGAGLLAALALATSPLTAQAVTRYVLVLPDAAVVDRLGALERMRDAIREDDAVAHANAIADLEERHASGMKGVEELLLGLGGAVVSQHWAIGAATVDLPTQAAPTVEASPLVAALWLDSVLGASMSRQTNAQNHASDTVNAAGADGSGVTIAILDSGIDIDGGIAAPHHPAFAAADGTSRIVKAVSFGGSPADDGSNASHGTGVAGIAAARDWGSPSPLSDDGFAPGANLASYRITFDAFDNYFSSAWLDAWHDVLRDRVSLNIVAAVASYKGNPDPTHPTQRIVDVVGYYGDVVIATSAGNLGQQEVSTLQSQSNANGLAVGAVHADTHVVADFSSRGPLPDDPKRTWPDLCAVGVGVYAPRDDVPSGTGFARSGTSFAAPCVAGTAALLRGVDASISALEAKAWILNATADLTAANPLGTRFDYGSGLLRADVAYAQATSVGTRFRGLSKAPGVHVETFSAQAGVRYAATLTWPRADDASADWADLDLVVKRPDGTPIGASTSPRNLYERVVFEPATSGEFRLEVVTVTATSPAPTWSLVVGANLDAPAQPGAFADIGAGCAGSGVDPGSGVIAPPGATTAWGDFRTAIPFATVATKSQFAIDGTTVPAGTRIDAIAFRADESVAASPSFTCDLEVRLGHTNAAPNALDSTFANNPAGPMTTVVNATSFALPGTAGAAGAPGEFEFIVPLETPFVTATSPNDHLLVEITMHGHSLGDSTFGLFFDAELDVLQHARVVATREGSVFPPAGTVDAAVPIVSLITAAPGSIAPRLDGTGSLAPGATAEVVLRYANTDASVVLAFGSSRTSWAGLPLPLDLEFLGAPACAVRSSIDGTIPGIADSFGTATVALPLSADPMLIGTEVFQQFFVFDPSANGLGLVTSSGGAIRIGGI